jgi:two-component system, OmpR family, phosphate regulon sensor histidine kinase PhoR
MFWRVFTYVGAFLLGGGTGWAVADTPGALFGVVVAALGWFVADAWRARAVLTWLRAGASDDLPLTGGLWREVADRTVRWTRQLRREGARNDARLHDFLAAIQASPNGVVLLDAQGHIEWCNETAAGHHGIDTARDMGQQIGNLLRHPEFAQYYAAQNFAQEVVIERRGRAATGSRTVSLQLHAYGEGRKLLLSRDITAQEQVEAMRRDFVANVSHEIRTPLTVLAGFVETLQNLPLSEAERTTYLALMAEQSQRMQSLVDDLLVLSRLEGSPPPSTQAWTPLVQIMQQCESEARALSASLGGGVASHVITLNAVPNVELAGSARELHSALSNLINNAVRYTPAGGRIEVSWHATNLPGVLHAGEPAPSGQTPQAGPPAPSAPSAPVGLVFSVQDTGPGIAPEHLPRLTERFYRVDRSRSRETGGTGLGLAIVKHALQRHGAELSITSRLGQGSCFAVVFAPSRVRWHAAAAPAG